MYGRVFESMFTGSMRGSGALVFAVWTYVIATMREDRAVGVQVELRPDLLEFYLGEEKAAIEAAIKKLCEPDEDSMCEEEEGRRLVQVGKYSYRVVSGPKYIAIRSAEDLREYRRLAKRREREKKRAVGNGKVRAPKIVPADDESVAEREAREVEEREVKLERGREMAEEAKAALLRTDQGGDPKF